MNVLPKKINTSLVYTILVLLITVIGCKKQSQDSELEYDNEVNKLLSGLTLNDARLKEVCSAISVKIFVANAEKFRTTTWEVAIPEEDKTRIAEYERSFEESIKTGRDDFIAAHSKEPKPCGPQYNTITYILSIFDGGSTTPDSEIDLIKFSYIKGEWKGTPLKLSYDSNVKKLDMLKANTSFELNMATDVVDIISQTIESYIPNYQQIELYINGHGGRSLSSPNMTDQVDLFDNHENAQSDHLILFDTTGPKGKLTSKLWSPVWRKETVKSICNDPENAAKKSRSIVCLALENNHDRQIGGVNGEFRTGRTSGEGAGTSGEGAGTSGDSGNTSGKIFRRVMPKIDKTKPFSYSNPEGIAQAGAVASYTINEDLYNELGISKINFYFPKASKPGYVLLNSCYQSDSIRNAFFSSKEVPFYANINPGPIYSWLVDYKLLNDYKYRVMPHLFHWRDLIQRQPNAASIDSESPDHRIRALANKLEQYTNSGLNGKRVIGHTPKNVQCTINNAYCELKTKSFTTLIWEQNKN